MLTGANIWYYVKQTITDTRFHKAIVAAVFATVSELTCCGRWLSLQFIFIAWLLTMFVWTIAWAITEWFSFKKLFKGFIRIVWYYIIMFLGVALDKAFDTWFIFKFFYAVVVLDLINIFLRHAPALWLTFSNKILIFVETIEKRVNKFFLKKIWLDDERLDEDFKSSQNNKNDWSTNLTSNVPDSWAV